MYCYYEYNNAGSDSPNYKYNIITEILHIALTRVKGHRISRLTDIIHTYMYMNKIR